MSQGGSFIQSGGPGSGDVIGPGSSVDGDIAIFSGTTGKVIADSGININNIAVNTPWTDVTGPVAAAKFNGYFSTGVTTSTLPATPAQGDVIKYIVDTASPLTIQASGTQVIRVGLLVSAAAGTAVSTLRGDSIELVYRSTGTAWIAHSSVGNWTIT